MDVVYAKYDAVVTTADGAQVRVVFGEHRPAADPVVQARPDVFSADPRWGVQWYGEPPAELAEAPVEQATAAPGEKRAAVRRG
jgi:hypothetical protein